MIGAFDSGSLEEASASVLDAALDKFIVATAVATSNLPADAPRSAARRAAGAAAVSLATASRGMDADISAKIATATAAGYAASFFGLPQNTLLDTADQVCGMFALTANQRRALHKQAAAILQNYVSTKGNAMSGILQNGSFRDGSLGRIVAQQRAFNEGSLGRIMAQQGATRDGSLGAIMAQQGAFRAGSLGIMPPPQFPVRDGSLGTLTDQRRRLMAYLRGFRLPSTRPASPNPKRARHADPRSATDPRPTAGLGNMRMSALYRPRVPYTGGPVGTRRARAISGADCGCSGVGADEVAVNPERPFYEKPLVIGGAAIVLGIVLYAATRRS